MESQKKKRNIIILVAGVAVALIVFISAALQQPERRTGVELAEDDFMLPLTMVEKYVSVLPDYLQQVVGTKEVEKHQDVYNKPEKTSESIQLSKPSVETPSTTPEIEQPSIKPEQPKEEPEITISQEASVILLGQNPQYMEVYTKYIESGVKVTGDDKAKVTIDKSSLKEEELGDYKVNYHIHFSNGKIGVLTRRVVVRDTTAPVITIVGGNYIEITQGQALVLPKTTVTDNYAKDLNTKFDGSKIDTNTVGTYQGVFTTRDYSGNTSQDILYVKVGPKSDSDSSSSAGTVPEQPGGYDPTPPGKDESVNPPAPPSDGPEIPGQPDLPGQGGGNDNNNPTPTPDPDDDIDIPDQGGNKPNLPGDTIPGPTPDEGIEIPDQSNRPSHPEPDSGIDIPSQG